MKKLLKWIGITFVALVVIGAIFGEKKEGGAAPAAQGAAAAAQEASPKQEVVTISARALAKGYEENEVAMDERIKGKLINVTGSVQSIDKDFTDSIVVSIATDNEFMPARLSLQDSEKAKAMQLVKGAKVAVLCEKMSRIVGSPSGRDCVLQ